MIHKVMLDTNAYSDAMRGKPDVIEILRSVSTILLNPIVIGELQFGFKNGTHYKKNCSQFETFCASPRVQLVTIDDETATLFANLMHQLKQKGTPIPTNDIWIAASALQNGCHLLTSDRHFKHIETLFVLP